MIGGIFLKPFWHQLHTSELSLSSQGENGISQAELPFTVLTSGGCLRCETLHSKVLEWASLTSEKKRQMSSAQCNLKDKGKAEWPPYPMPLSACQRAWNFPIIHCLGLLYRNTKKAQILPEVSHAAQVAHKKTHENHTKLGLDPGSRWKQCDTWQITSIPETLIPYL